MPTSVLRPAMLGSPMGLSFPASYRPDSILISPISMQACGNEFAGLSMANAFISRTYPGSSLVIAYPFVITANLLVRKVWWCNGTTATTDSADVGVYNEAGTSLLVSGGSTAISGANAVQEVDCTDTLLLAGRYWCAYIQGGVTATPIAANASSATIMRVIGYAQQAGSGSTLGSTFTPAAMTGAVVPLCGIAGRTQVA